MSRPEGNPSPQEHFRTTYNNLERVSVVRPRDHNILHSTAAGAHTPATAARCPNRVYIAMHPIDLLEAFGWGDAERLAAPALYVALLEAVIDGHILGSGPFAAYLQTGTAPARPGGEPNPPEFEVAIANALLMNTADEDEDEDEDDEDDDDDAVFDADDEDDGELVDDDDDDDEDQMALEDDDADQAQRVRSVRRKRCRETEAQAEAQEGGRARRKRTRTRYLEASAELDQPASHAATDAASSGMKRKWSAVEGPSSSGSAHRAETRWVGQTTVFAPPMRLPRHTLQLFSVYMPDTEEF
ncbi:hypothetical protein SLS58_006424 [Diplodia intermedia]|uniref:Uncharacterized protein n=1 Tax=Diplodia intermedia TaxID=856260 RepID=A0ABR3TN08_9PEZI